MTTTPAPEQFTPRHAHDPSTPPDVLALIAEHRPDLRALVAANPSTGEPVLAWLETLRDVGVSTALKARPRVAVEKVADAPEDEPLPAGRPLPAWLFDDADDVGAGTALASGVVAPVSMPELPIQQAARALDARERRDSERGWYPGLAQRATVPAGAPVAIAPPDRRTLLPWFVGAAGLVAALAASVFLGLSLATVGG
ncbi:hypothetical protein [Georgenia alba]|uniref:Leucine rich repeat variant domain-containing protein n=1 Tax=Georgenia alba TaxID=2233858 RepID=A0ABW2Q820_9MICO